MIVTVKKSMEPRADKWASLDINMTNIKALINGRIVRYDLKELYHIHRVYEAKRQRIQRLSKPKPKASEKLMQKYSRRERNRAKDFMHKLTTEIVRELKESNSGAIMERLRGIKQRVLNSSKEQNRKLSKWNARTSSNGLGYQ